MSGSESDKGSHLALMNLDRDMPLTEEDIAVLRRLKQKVALTPAQYERFLEQFGHASPEELRKRPVFKGEPFEL